MVCNVTLIRNITVLILVVAAALWAAPAHLSAALSASISDLVLPSTVYSHAAQVTSGQLQLTVVGDGTEGWNVTVRASDFAYSGENNGTAIPAANFAITAANAPTLVSGQAIDATGGPRVPVTGATGALDTDRKVIQADAGFGQGTYGQALDVDLTIPARSRAGTYSSSLTVTASVGP